MNQKAKSTTGTKILRLIIWGIVVILGPVSLCLLRKSQSSEAISNGTSSNLGHWGEIFLSITLVLFAINFVWGIVRWSLKWSQEKWKLEKVVARLIGGGIWRGAVFGVLLALGLVFIGPAVTKAFIKHQLAKTEKEWLTGEVGIEWAYHQDQISADEYIENLINLMYHLDDLPKEFRATDVIKPNLITAVDENIDKISAETTMTALEAAWLTNLEFDTDASGNISSNKTNWLDTLLGIQPVQAQTKKILTLNKAKLSTKGNFVVFYTDTGDDAISDADAENLANMMEDIVNGYQTYLGQPYSYKKLSASNAKEQKQREVLAANNLPEDLIDRAMPVYVANPYSKETGILATYAGTKFEQDTTTKLILKVGQAIGDETSKFYASTPAYPFVNIPPSNVRKSELKIVATHEMGHHFSELYCYRYAGAPCSNNDFVAETAPNWMTANIVFDVPEGNTIQKHYKVYLKYGTCYRIDTVLPNPESSGCHNSGSYPGYPAYAFLENYAELVPNGAEKIWQSLSKDNALEFLWQEAGAEKFAEVMLQLSRRNLTGSYEYDADMFDVDILPSGTKLPCKDLCRTNYEVQSAAIRYFYFPIDEYGGTKVTIKATDNETVTVMGLTPNGTWETITSKKQNLEYEIDDPIQNKFTYFEYAVIVTNTAIAGNDIFSLELAPTEIAKATDIKWGEGCRKLSLDSMMDTSEDLIQGLIILDKEHADEYQDIWNQASELKDGVASFSTTICDAWLGAGANFEKIKHTLENELALGLTIKDKTKDGLHTTLIVGIDELGGQAKSYQLQQDETETYLMIVTVEF